MSEPVQADEFVSIGNHSLDFPKELLMVCYDLCSLLFSPHTISSRTEDVMYICVLWLTPVDTVAVERTIFASSFRSTSQKFTDINCPVLFEHKKQDLWLHYNRLYYIFTKIKYETIRYMHIIPIFFLFARLCLMDKIRKKKQIFFFL